MTHHWIDLTALWLTVRLAAVTTLILLALGLPDCKTEFQVEGL